jgi:hypothetical protein
MIYKILQRKLKIEQHKPHQKSGVTAPLVAPVMLLQVQTEEEKAMFNLCENHDKLVHSHEVHYY